MENSYASQLTISREMLARADYVAYAMEGMKREGAIKVFNEIYNCGHPVVVETHIEEWDEWDTKKYTLHYRLTAVQARNFVIPVFTYVNHTGKVEWKCRACGMVNDIEAQYCGQRHTHAAGCGSPREKTREHYV